MNVFCRGSRSDRHRELQCEAIFDELMRDDDLFDEEADDTGDTGDTEDTEDTGDE